MKKLIDSYGNYDFDVDLRRNFKTGEYEVTVIELAWGPDDSDAGVKEEQSFGTLKKARVKFDSIKEDMQEVRYASAL